MGSLSVKNQILGMRIGVSTKRFKLDLFISSLVGSRTEGSQRWGEYDASRKDQMWVCKISVVSGCDVSVSTECCPKFQDTRADGKWQE